MFIFVRKADLEILMLFICPSVRDNVENEWPEWHKWPDDRKLRRQFTVWYIFILPSLLFKIIWHIMNIHWSIHFTQR